jgi:predicted Zn-dependent protease
MAHEIAHVAACHAARESTRGQLLNLASIPLIFVGGGIGYAIQNAAGLAVPLSFLKFSRGFESEADFLGLQYMYKAGYDPQAFTAFFEKVEARNKVKPGTLAKAFSTHPQTPDRIAKTQKEIATVLPARDQYKVDTSEFQEVKAHLASIENRRRVDFARAQDRPTLRRGAHPNRAESGNSGDDEERPRLRRRNDSGQDQ